MTTQKYYQKHREEILKYAKEYNQRIEVKEHRKKYYKEYSQRPEVKEHITEYRQKHREEIKEYLKQYYQRPEIKKHIKEYKKEYQKEYYQRPEVRERERAHDRIRDKLPKRREQKNKGNKKYCEKPEVQLKNKIYRKERWAKLKLIVLTYYGGNPPKCACCNESRIEFLTIDHVNNDGKKHRKQIGSPTGGKFYRWLVQHNFPNNPLLQVLCFNCNYGKRVNGGICPHEKARGIVKDMSELK